MKISDSNLREATLELWQPRYTQKLTKENGREIMENITNFFDLLDQWAEVSPPGRHCSENPENTPTLKKERKPR